ncbi:MAG TPA: DUF4082 domain-containing protein, partial [Jatrophihabitantaceae bacterium]
MIKVITPLVAVVLLIGVIIAGMALDSKVSGASAVKLISIYPDGTVPDNPSENDRNAVELGVQFAVSQPGAVVGLRFYKSARNSGVHVGNLWDASGRRLATATFANETAAGWQTITFADPVTLKAGTRYTASYHTSAGYYAERQWAFRNGAVLGNSVIRATSGVYVYGRGGFPTHVWHSAAYYMDVLFQPAAAAGGGSTTSLVPVPTLSTSKPPPSGPVVTGTPTEKISPPGASSPVTTTTSPSTPSGSPNPSSGGSSSGGWPDASNTGVPAGTVLKRVPEDVRSGPGWTSNASGTVTVT